MYDSADVAVAQSHISKLSPASFTYKVRYHEAFTWSGREFKRSSALAIKNVKFELIYNILGTVSIHVWGEWRFIYGMS